jgi:hypothetical protein
MKIIVFIMTALSLGAATARADDCDYVGRHYKTDIQPVAVRTFPASRSGDISYPASLRISVQNVGFNTVSDPAQPGDIIHARRIAVNVKGQTLYGWLPAPLAPGATTDFAVSLPDGLLGACESTALTIDADWGVGQYGCQVHANDALAFQAFFNPRICAIIIHHSEADE